VSHELEAEEIIEAFNRFAVDYVVIGVGRAPFSKPLALRVVLGFLVANS
jgi:hypothetical protein